MQVAVRITKSLSQDRSLRVAGGALLALAFLVLVLAVPASATNVGGTIATDTTWTLAGSPYVVTSNVFVQGTNGADGVTTLTIEPGVEVRFQQNTQLQVGTNVAASPGALVADGTLASPITFTSDQVTHTRGYWYYLYFADFSRDDLSILDNVVVEYGGAGTANLYLYNAAPAISNLVSRESSTHGAYFNDASPTVTSSTFELNDEHGVFIYGGTPTFTSSSFKNNGLYGLYTNHGAPTLTSNAFEANAQRPLRFNPLAAFSGNSFTASTTKEIELLGATITADRTLPKHSDSDTATLLPYIVTGSLTIQGTSGGDGVTTLTLDPGVEMRFDQSASVTVGSGNPSFPGALSMPGTAASPILLTSNQVTHTRGWWGGVNFHDYASDSASRLENVTIEYAGGSAGLYLNTAAPKVANCTIREGSQHGVYMYYADATLTSCNIRNNTKHGVYVYASGAGTSRVVAGTLEGNGLYGLYTEYGTNIDVTDSLIKANAQRPLRLHPNSKFTGNTYEGNTLQEIEFNGGTQDVDQALPKLTDAVSAALITYVYTASVTVSGTSGADGITTLTVSPGVTVQFDGNFGMTVGSNSASVPGALNAKGTAAEPILFTSHQTSKTPGFWSYLYFADFAEATVLENVTVEYGGSSSYMSYFYQNDIVVKNSVWRHSANAGLYLYNANPTLLGSAFKNNGGHGIWNYYGSPTVTGATFEANAKYGFYTDSGIPQVTNSAFKANSQRPLRVHPASAISGNTFDGNALQEIEFTSGTQNVDRPLVRYLDAVSSAPLSYVYTGSVTISGTDGGDGVTTLSVDPGVTVKFDQSVSMTVGSNSASTPGALRAPGTAALPILFTSHQTTPTRGWWGNLYFADYADSSFLENVTVEYGGSGSYMVYLYYNDMPLRDTTIRESGDAGLYLYGANPTILRSTFFHNAGHGIWNYYGSPTIDDGRFENNGKYGLFTDSGEPSVTDSLFKGNSQRPARVHPESLITGNTFDGNVLHEWEFNGGTQTTDQTLPRVLDLTSSAPLMYVYVGSVTVQGTDGADGITSLTVGEGVTVAYDQFVAMAIGSNSASLPGALHAGGSAALPIVFTSHQSGTKTAGYWGPLQFNDYASEAASALRNVTVEFGGRSTAGLYLYRFGPTLSDCTVSKNANHGLYLYDSEAVLERCTVQTSSAHGVYVYSGNAVVRDSVLKANAQYGLFTNSGQPDVTNTAIESNTQRPLRVAPDSVLVGNTYKTNTLQEIEFNGGIHTEDKVLARVTDVLSGVPLTYVYVGSVTVQGLSGPDGVTTLTVEPGVTVAFDQFVTMNIGSGSSANPGALVADGSAAMPIVFTSHQSGTKTAGYWGPLQFNDYAEEGISKLRNLTVEFGGRSTGALYFYRFAPTVSDCVVTKSGTHGFYINDADPTLERCTVQDSVNHGIFVTGTNAVVVRDCLLKANAQYGLFTSSGSRADITGCTLQANKQRPLRLHPEASFGGNTFRSNVIQEVEFNGGTIALDETLARIVDADNGVTVLKYAYTASVTVRGTDGPDGITTLTVDPGVTVLFDLGTYAQFGGSVTLPGALDARGTAALPILFSSHRATPVAGDWGGLRFSSANAQSVLENVTVGFGGSGTVGNLYIYDSDVVVKGSRFFRSSNYGVMLQNQLNFRFEGNEMDLNQRGLYVASGTAYDIVGNRLHNNSFGGYMGAGTATWSRNRFEDNTNRGLYYAGSNSLVYDNLFRNNVNAEDQGTGNLWNTTKTAASPLANIIGGAYFGGNRWSNYTGLDADYDGLGDTLVPHKTIGKGNDTHPLTLPSEVVPDLLPPVTTLVLTGTLGNNGWYVGPVTATLSATDDASGVKATYYRVDGGAPSTYMGPVAFTADGARTLGYWSVDFANNTEAERTEGAGIDATPPSVGVSLTGTPGPGGWYASSVSVTVTAADATSGMDATEYSLDGGLFLPYAGTVTVAGDGAHSFRARGTDKAGNVKLVNTTVRIDVLPPVTNPVLVGTAGSNGWWRSNLSVTLDATDAGSGVFSTHKRLDGGAWQTYTGAFGVSGEGTHSLDYYSVDNVGHVEATLTVQPKIDSVAPATAFAAGEPQYADGTGLYVRSATPLTLTATDATSGVAGTTYRVSPGGVNTTYAGPFTVGGADGSKTVTYGSTDVAGNVEPTRTQVVKLDNTAPTVSVARPRVGSLSAFALYVETDSDWDYVPDAVETALGTNPYDPASHPPVNPPDEVDDIHERYRYAYIVSGTTVPLTAAATDPLVGGVASGMDHVAFYLDGALLATDDAAPYIFDWDTTPLTLGKHLLEVRGVDHLGNERVVSVPVFALAQPNNLAEAQAALEALLPADVLAAPAAPSLEAEPTVALPEGRPLAVDRETFAALLAVLEEQFRRA